MNSISCKPFLIINYHNGNGLLGCWIESVKFRGLVDLLWKSPHKYTNWNARIRQRYIAVDYQLQAPSIHLNLRENLKKTVCPDYKATSKLQYNAKVNQSRHTDRQHHSIGKNWYAILLNMHLDTNVFRYLSWYFPHLFWKTKTSL